MAAKKRAKTLSACQHRMAVLIAYISAPAPNHHYTALWCPECGGYGRYKTQGDQEEVLWRMPTGPRFDGGSHKR